MGLDNGIIVKSNKRQLTRNDLPTGIVYPFNEDYQNGIEIVYWRKCWGIRNEIMNTFGWRFIDDQYQFEIDTPEQVFKLIEIIASWLDEKRWDEEGNSIWEYDTMRSTLIANIVNLSMIYIYMFSNPDVYLEFYDSY